MLEPFEMELILRQNFYDFFEEHRYNSDDADLLYRMEAFDKSTVSYIFGYFTMLHASHNIIRVLFVPYHTS